MWTKSKQRQGRKSLEQPGLEEGVPASTATISSKNSNFITQTELCGIKNKYIKLSPRNSPLSKPWRTRYLFIPTEEKKKNIYIGTISWNLFFLGAHFNNPEVLSEMEQKTIILKKALQWLRDTKHKGIFATLSTNNPPKNKVMGIWDNKYE